MLDELVEQYEDRLQIVGINIDEQPSLAAEYGIRAIPTLVLLRRGQVAERIVGPRCKRDLDDCLNQAGA
jgi:thioredoxin-like negative regulator of GroEL